MKKSIIAFSCLALMFASCEKDKNEDESVAVTMESVSGTYSLGTVTAKVGSSPEQDYTDFWYDEACMKDDKVTFNANGAVIFTDAGVKCDPPGDDTGTWSLSNSNTKINIDGEEFTIQSFNGKVLKVGETDNSNGTSISVTITLNKQ